MHTKFLSENLKGSDHLEDHGVDGVIISELILGWTIGVLGFDSRRGLGIFLFTTMSRTALRPTQPPIQWVPGALSLGVKRPGRGADQSPPSSAKVKDTWSYTSTPHYVFMVWCLVKHRDNFTFTFSYRNSVGRRRLEPYGSG
jgi:hypothetical protein